MRSRTFFVVPALAIGLCLPAGPAAATVRPATTTHSSHLRHLLKRQVLVRHVLRVAPADEYFGRLKMSILGIGNELHDLTARAQFVPEKSSDVLGPAHFVEDALHDWEHKYPADPWLAKDVFALTQLYAQVHTSDGLKCQARTLHWLLGRYGRTRYATLAKTQIVTTVK